MAVLGTSGKDQVRLEIRACEPRKEGDGEAYLPVGIKRGKDLHPSG